RDESGFDAINHLLLLAQNETGYRNLIHLVSKGYLEGFYYKPRIDLDLLRAHSEGLIATSGCLSSMVSRAITGGQLDTAWQLVSDFADIFRDRYYLESCDHEHHDALLCIGTATNLDDPKRFRFDGHGFYVKDGDEMAEVFRDHPSALTSSLEIAERCDLELGIDTGRYQMPEFQVPAGTT